MRGFAAGRSRECSREWRIYGGGQNRFETDSICSAWGVSPVRAIS